MKPEWIIYKNDQKTGEAITWHKALDILMIQEQMKCVKIDKLSGVVFIYDENNLENRYKIVKER